MLYQKVLDELTESCRQIFGSVLTGVYLHGSLAMGCFNPDKSDLDVIVVIEKEITDEQKLAFMRVITRLNGRAPKKGIELSVVKREYCREFVYPTPFELHFSPAHLQWFLDEPADYIQKMKGTDKDLAAHFTIIKKYGIALYGPEVSEVFGEVPKEAYMDSIWYDIEGAGEDILDQPMYIVLNLCRVAAFVKDNEITSKEQGGIWALGNLESGYRELVKEALRCYETDREMSADQAELQRFSAYMLHMIQNARAEDAEEK